MARSKVISLTMRDEPRLEMLKVVVGYEAGVRGVSRGAALYELVMEAVDTGSYPEEVRAYLARLRDERLKGALEGFTAETGRTA